MPQQFAAQRGRPRGDLPALIHELGLEQGVLNQPWTELSVRLCAAGRVTVQNFLLPDLRPHIKVSSSWLLFCRLYETTFKLIVF